MCGKSDREQAFGFIVCAVLVLLIAFNIMVMIPATDIHIEPTRDVIFQGVTQYSKDDVDAFCSVMRDLAWYKHYLIETDNTQGFWHITVYSDEHSVLMVNWGSLLLGVVFNLFIIVACMAAVHYNNKD